MAGALVFDKHILFCFSDGKSTKSDDSKSSASSSDDEKKPKDGAADEEEPATGEGAPMGRKRSSLKITLSREKQPAGEMSPKSPQLIVINGMLDFPSCSAEQPKWHLQMILNLTLSPMTNSRLFETKCVYR